jgi:hypothetical protein
LSDDRQQVRTLATSLAATVASFAGASAVLAKPVRNAQTERTADMTTNVQEVPNGEQDEPAVRNSVATFAAKING